MTGRVFATLREAIHAVATSGRPSMKVLAGELDWSPSELSMRTTLGGDSSRAFPLDEAHLVTLMETTGDYSPLFTLADLCGFEITPKKERIGEMVSELKQEAQRLASRLQLVLDLKIDQPKGKR